MSDLTPIQTPAQTPPRASQSPAPPPAADNRPAPPERLHGVIDVLRPNRIAGWAIDRADAAASVTVDILRDGQRVATLRADRARPDLEKGGIGTGRYGFLFDLDPPLDPGFEFTVSAIARTQDGHTLALAPVGAAVHPVPPDLKLLQRLHAAVSDLAAARSAPDPRAETLAAALDRVEVILARMEQRLDALDGAAPPPRDPRFRALSLAAMAVAATSLGIGLWSLFG